MSDKGEYGFLINKNTKLHRQWFKEMVKLIGIQVVYIAPRPGKTYTTYGEIESSYYDAEVVGCIFDEHPSQQTMKKIGWVSELVGSASLISVPYDLRDLQVGALFIIPSGLDDGVGRVFRVTKLNTTMIYPASITCEIVPEYESVFPSDIDERIRTDDFPLINDTDDSEDDISSYSIIEE